MEAPVGGGGKDLDVKGVTLQTFKNRVDEILRTLAESPAGHQQIGEQKVTADAYGTGFSAASDLHSGYEKVRTRLENLSKMFGETIEALGIAVQVADKGYTGIDVDVKDRFKEIQKRNQEFYAAEKSKESGSGGAADSSTYS
ncbi:hypothetical protein [Streptomyces thermolilacinus]|uniref:hypothetical protein n=1 Tax=Streptomyces thermolilacinus TaxID=285540 RepID=UPI0003C771D3|nr:hypothetical protein [Streptomyces thermolilacinus]